MKKPIVTAIAAACLLQASLFATKVGELAHQHLKYKSAKTTYELVDGNDIVTVVKEALPPESAAKHHRFKVTITRKSSELRTYSLLTLGVQTVTQDVGIVTASPGVKFGRISDTTAGSTAPLLVAKTGLVGEGEKSAVNADNVWLVSLETDQCELLVQPLPNRIVTTEWWLNGGAGFAEGHGTEPP